MGLDRAPGGVDCGAAEPEKREQECGAVSLAGRGRADLTIREGVPGDHQGDRSGRPGPGHGGRGERRDSPAGEQEEHGHAEEGGRGASAR